MKVAFVLLAVAVASAYAGYEAEPYRQHYGEGFHHTPNGVVSAYRNDLRQVHVNRVADYVGAGTGTADINGVPGTNGHYSNYGYGYGRGYGNGYGHGYGYGAYGHRAYGNGYGAAYGPAY